MSHARSRFNRGQTALLADIPEAQSVVGAWRARFDTSAAAGVGPHVTVLFPFRTLPSITAIDRTALAAIAAAEPIFTVTFSVCGVFPSAGPKPAVLHLVPTPDRPFRRLIAAFAARWPQCPPYGGAFDDPTPHLTITETAADTDLDAARRAIEPLLPVTSTVRGVRMIAFDGTTWQPEAWFPLRCP